MAKLVAVGKPANDAEKWAFEFLESNLPDSYTVITNVDVYADHGQPFECDAIIVAEWAVYVVDVKGYQGRLSAGKDVWLHGSKEVENPLPKLHQNARILASRCKLKRRNNQHAPWCQGLAFITGGLGNDIVVVKGEEKLPVYHKNNIIKALTSSEYVTSIHKYPLQEEQKHIALSAICDFKLLEKKKNKIAGYIKKEHLSTKDGIELWIAEPEDRTFDFQYWMKFADLSGKSAHNVAEITAKLKKEFYILSELADLPSVPAALSLHEDGESIALVHQNILGQPLSKAYGFNLREVMIEVAETLSEMEKRGVHHRILSLDNIFLSPDGKVQLLDVGFAKSKQMQTLISASQLDSPWLPVEYIEKGIFNAQSLSYLFAHVFLPLISSKPPTSNSTLDYQGEHYVLDKNSLDPSIIEAYQWIDTATNLKSEVRSTLDEFIECFENTSLSQQENTDISFEPGAQVNDKYELIECIGKGGASSVWKARHLLGEYTCCLKVLDTFDGSEDIARKEFEVLRVLYHPNIVRIFDIDVIPNRDQYFITCEFLDGASLGEIGMVSVEDGLKYFKEILSALQYLHRLKRIHKDIKPENIIISNGKANLIDFNISMLDSRLIGTTRYKDPLVKDSGWTPFSDIYSLVITFVELFTEQHPFQVNDEIPSVDISAEIHDSKLSLPSHVRSKFEQILKHDIEWDGIQDYCAWFGISDQIEIDIPQIMMSEWGINSGYMLKVLKVMLADMQPRSRKVVVRNTLKEHGIVGNTSNKGSVNASISALKSNGIIEDYGAKIRLTELFVESWNTSNKARCF